MHLFASQKIDIVKYKIFTSQTKLAAGDHISSNEFFLTEIS